MENSKSEYEIQQFGFSVNTIQCENRVMIKNQVGIVTNNLAENLIKKLNLSPTASHEMYCRVRDVSMTTVKSIEMYYKEFDNLFEKYFAIPDNVILPQDVNHKKFFNESNEADLIKKVDAMKITYDQNKILLDRLNTELKTYEKVDEHINNENLISLDTNNILLKITDLGDVNATIKKVEDVFKSEDVKLYTTKYK